MLMSKIVNIGLLIFFFCIEVWFTKYLNKETNFVKFVCPIQRP